MRFIKVLLRVWIQWFIYKAAITTNKLLILINHCILTATVRTLFFIPCHTLEKANSLYKDFGFIRSVWNEGCHQFASLLDNNHQIDRGMSPSVASEMPRQPEAVFSTPFGECRSKLLTTKASRWQPEQSEIPDRPRTTYTH